MPQVPRFVAGATLTSVLVTCRSRRGEKLPESIRTSLRSAIRQVVTGANPDDS